VDLIGCVLDVLSSEVFLRRLNSRFNQSNIKLMSDHFNSVGGKSPAFRLLEEVTLPKSQC